MIDTRRKKIKCPKCGKMICSMEYNAHPEGIYFWCPRCKKEFEIKEKKIFRALEADNS